VPAADWGGVAPVVSLRIDMRALMFGWEFSPHLTGGLATATVGLVKGLVRQGVAVTLVVPFPVSESPIPSLRLVSASRAVERVRRIAVPSPVAPYGTAERYVAEWEQAGPPPLGDAALLSDWRRLTTSDHLYYMCTKWFADGEVHKYFSPYDSPYDAYIALANVLQDLERRVAEAREAAMAALDHRETPPLFEEMACVA
jgi:hypothetical protein